MAETAPIAVVLTAISIEYLRHGAATMALAAGVEMKVLQHMLRHASEATTSMVYTSVLPAVARAASRASPRRS